MAHPSWPWQDEQLAMLVHKPNVYMDLSRLVAEVLLAVADQYANFMIQDKVCSAPTIP